MSDIPVFDLTLLCEADAGDEAYRATCEAIAKCLRDTGLLLVKHPRVSAADNDAFLDLIEQYFADEQAAQQDVRPELCYQVGLTPSGVETPRVLLDEEMQQRVKQLPEGHTATLPQGPDVKARYMWRCGPRPEKTNFPELNAQPVIPKAFPQWQSVMDGFSGRLLDVAHTVAQAAAVGFGLEPDALTQRMQYGPHILAPTGSNLERYGQLGTVLAGYHSDLNLLTLHGKSRFPGLFVWMADGTKTPVKVPQGCVLVQAGQQLEALTGGYVKAGMHEVVVTPQTRAAYEDAKAHGRSTWRVSSTLFTHLASDSMLEPLGHFAHSQPKALERYPPRPTGVQVQQELEAISLKSAKRRESMGEGKQHQAQCEGGKQQSDRQQQQHAVSGEGKQAEQQHAVNGASGKENMGTEASEGVRKAVPLSDKASVQRCADAEGQQPQQQMKRQKQGHVEGVFEIGRECAHEQDGAKSSVGVFLFKFEEVTCRRCRVVVLAAPQCILPSSSCILVSRSQVFLVLLRLRCSFWTSSAVASAL